VPDQHDWDRPEAGDDIVERLVQVMDRRGLRAVPAPEPEAGPADRGAAPPQRVPDRRRDRNHAQHGGLKRVGELGARRLAAVRDHDDAGGDTPASAREVAGVAAW